MVLFRSRSKWIQTSRGTFCLQSLIATAVVLIGASFPPLREAGAAPAACDAKTMSILESSTSPVVISCSLALEADTVIQTPIILSGSAASQSIIDCHGGTIRSNASDQVALTIASVHQSDGGWDVPKHIAIRHCRIEGGIRIIGMGENGEAELVRQSSLSVGHTARAQAAAPSDIMLSDLKIMTKGAIPLYVGPGSTKLTVANTTFSGKSGSVGIYLDAESAKNTISNDHFELATKSREIIALDGSADDVITENTFENPTHGGVFLYRNCGEGGTIRHQPPQHDTISNNFFRYTDHGLTSWWTTKPAIWLGSRQGNRSYCFHDVTRPFGSSLSSRDEAKYNLVRDNRMDGGSVSLIVDNDSENQIMGNR